MHDLYVVLEVDALLTNLSAYGDKFLLDHDVPLTISIWEYNPKCDFNRFRFHFSPAIYWLPYIVKENYLMAGDGWIFLFSMRYWEIILSAIYRVLFDYYTKHA